MARNDLLKDLSPEQIEKARACHNQEELLALAKAEGVELSDEQLQAVNGGGCVEADVREEKGFVCPNCGSKNTKGKYNDYAFNSEGGYECVCYDCSAHFQAQSK